MKWILIAVVVALLVLAQIVFGPKKDGAAPAAPTAETVAAVPEQTPEPAPEESPAKVEAPALPSPDNVAVISVGYEAEALRIVRVGDADEWTVATRGDFPADGERVQTFLANLLTAERLNVMLDNATETGLEEGRGLGITLTAKDGKETELRLGLRPAGSYASAYVRLPDGGVNLVTADVRGDLGLWENTPAALPEPSDWIQKTVLFFNPADATRIEADYPDHKILFEKSPEGEWEAKGYVPSGEWNRDALAAWLESLADFRIADIVPSEEFPEGDAGQTHALIVTLANGTAKTVRIRPHHAGEGMLAATSEFPGRVFRLPEWRFTKYFRVLDALFPDAAPRFELADVRFIDILRGGEKVKLARREGGWQALAIPYPVRDDKADRLARLLSSWRPGEYASPDFKAVRPHYGAPTVEVTLDGGDAHQYRLGGWHPVFPWRYVVVDGKEIFAATDSGAEAMFPEFAEVLDLGRVFHRMTLDDTDVVEFAAEDGSFKLAFTRIAGGKWLVFRDGRQGELSPEDVQQLLAEPLAWAVAGFSPAAPAAAAGEAAPEYRLRLYGQDGTGQSIAVLRPRGRGIPYVDPADDGRGYLIDRTDFQNWLAAARGILPESAGNTPGEEANAKE